MISESVETYRGMRIFMNLTKMKARWTCNIWYGAHRR
ncbi:hypothetical protein P3T23_000021 [Paraburkholderia sp. GAS448]